MNPRIHLPGHDHSWHEIAEIGLYSTIVAVTVLVAIRVIALALPLLGG
jgi:hypothetical protein